MLLYGSLHRPSESTYLSGGSRAEDVKMGDITPLASESNRRSFERSVKSLIREGYSASQILTQVWAVYLSVSL
jgi:hypothetical protein